MDPHQKTIPSHGRPSSSSAQDYRYPTPSAHHFAPAPGSTFHHAYTASLIAAGHPEQHQQQPASVLQQRDVITRLSPRLENRGYQQPDPLAIIPGNMDHLEPQRIDAFKKQALTANPYFYHPNFAVTSAGAVDNLQASLGLPKESSGNLVVGSAIAMDNTAQEHSHMVTNLDIASSSTSSSSTCPSLHTPSNPDAVLDSSGQVDTSAQRDVIAGSVREPTAAEAAELLRLKHAPKANSMIQTLLRKGGEPPDGISYDQYTNDPNDIRVIASKVIEPGQVYGPLKGNVKTLDCLHNTQAWELCLNGMVAAYIAPTQRKEWMGYVRNARYPEECNIEAGQIYGRIHFTVTKRIEPGTELRAFYSDIYRENCGFMYDLAALNYSKDEDNFSCTMCSVKIDNSKSMVRHYMVTHPDDGLQEQKSLPLKVAERLKLLNAQCKLPPQYEEGTDEEEDERDEENTRDTPNGQIGRKETSGKQAASHIKKHPAKKNNDINHVQNVNQSQRFICPTCGKSFATHGRLMMHESFHEAEDEVNSVEEEDDLEEELNEDGGDYDDDEEEEEEEEKEEEEESEKVGDSNGDGIRCNICDFGFQDRKKCAAHEKKHKTHRYMCIQCGNLYVRKTHMYRHQREVHSAVFIRPNRSVNAFMKNYTSAKAPELKYNDMSDRGKDYAPQKVANQCKACNYVAPSKDTLKEHITFHEGKPFGCDQCGSVYAIRSNLYKHLRQKHGTSKDQFFTPQRREMIKKYLTEKSNDVKGFRCKECGFRCRDKQSLREHRLTHWGNGSKGVGSRRSTICEVCGYKTPDQQIFAEHIEKHKKTPFGCRVCGNTYINNKSLVRHYNEKHVRAMDTKNVDKSILKRARAALSQHKDACPQCAYYTPNQTIRRRHLAKHRNSPYGCVACGNCYTRKTTLRRHQKEKHWNLLSGRDEKSTAMSSQADFTELLQEDTVPEDLGIEGDTCPTCGFQSPDKKLLTDHVILHVTHPYGCNLCGFVYTKKKAIVRHVREKHPEAVGGIAEVVHVPQEEILGTALDMVEVEDERDQPESQIEENNANDFVQDGALYSDRGDAQDRLPEAEEDWGDDDKDDESLMEEGEEYSDEDRDIASEEGYDDEKLVEDEI